MSWLRSLERGVTGFLGGGASGTAPLSQGVSTVVDRIGDGINTAKDYGHDLYNDVTGVTDRNFNEEEAQKQRDWEERMSSTSHQRAMADRKAAGMNPLVEGGISGASTPSGAVAAPSHIGEGTRSLFGYLIPAMKSFAEIRNINSSTARNYTEAGDVSATQPGRISLVQNQALSEAGRLLSIQATTKLTDAQRNKIDSEVKKILADAFHSEQLGNKAFHDARVSKTKGDIAEKLGKAGNAFKMNGDVDQVFERLFGPLKDAAGDVPGAVRDFLHKYKLFEKKGGK